MSSSAPSIRVAVRVPFYAKIAFALSLIGRMAWRRFWFEKGRAAIKVTALTVSMTEDGDEDDPVTDPPTPAVASSWADSERESAEQLDRDNATEGGGKLENATGDVTPEPTGEGR